MKVNIVFIRKINRYWYSNQRKKKLKTIKNYILIGKPGPIAFKY